MTTKFVDNVIILRCDKTATKKEFYDAKKKH